MTRLLQLNLAPKKFLIVDADPNGRCLLSRAVQRKFPRAQVRECGHATTAISVLGKETPDAVVVHRAGEIDGLALVRTMREASPRIPIIFVSSLDRASAALESGATEFLNSEAWFRIGSLLADVLTRDQSPQSGGPAPA